MAMALIFVLIIAASAVATAAFGILTGGTSGAGMLAGVGLQRP